MLLIIFLVVIAKLALVSCDCNYGNLNLKYFDMNKLAGSWLTLLHNSNNFENNIDCSETVISSPHGNISIITNNFYDVSEKSHMKFYGYATNWNSSSYVEFYHSVPKWNGRLYILAIDYDRYIIGKHCSFDSKKPYYYVGFRSQHPDEATVKEVLKVLQDSRLDVSQLVELRADNCRQAESSTAGGGSV